MYASTGVKLPARLLQAVPSWVLDVTKFERQLIASNAKAHCVASYIMNKRIRNWDICFDWCCDTVCLV